MCERQSDGRAGRDETTVATEQMCDVTVCIYILVEVCADLVWTRVRARKSRVGDTSTVCESFGAFPESTRVLVN